jgi:Uri superfamily endonuclease
MGDYFYTYTCQECTVVAQEVFPFFNNKKRWKWHFNYLVKGGNLRISILIFIYDFQSNSPCYSDVLICVRK